MKTLLVPVVLAVLAGTASAQLPDAPKAKTVEAIHTNLLHDVPVLRLAAAELGSQIIDIKTTQDSLRRGNHEDNFIYGNDPSVGRMIAIMIPENIITAYIGHKMRYSDVTLFRKTWWVPQTITIAVHSDAAYHNTRVQ